MCASPIINPEHWPLLSPGYDDMDTCPMPSYSPDPEDATAAPDQEEGDLKGSTGDLQGSGKDGVTSEEPKMQPPAEDSVPLLHSARATAL